MQQYLVSWIASEAEEKPLFCANSLKVLKLYIPIILTK